MHFILDTAYKSKTGKEMLLCNVPGYFYRRVKPLESRTTRDKNYHHLRLHIFSKGILECSNHISGANAFESLQTLGCTYICKQVHLNTVQMN